MSEKETSQEWNRLRPELLRFECADLRVIESCHKICSDFSRFLFAYGLRDILLIGLENVFKRAAIHGSASIAEQFNRYRRSRQQEGDQDCREMAQGFEVTMPFSKGSSRCKRWINSIW